MKKLRRLLLCAVLAAAVSMPMTAYAAECVVRYRDGTGGEVFEDKVFHVNENDATPAFGENPVREGYAFNGWYPDVMDKVESDITYTATWIQGGGTPAGDGSGAAGSGSGDGIGGTGGAGGTGQSVPSDGSSGGSPNIVSEKTGVLKETKTAEDVDTGESDMGTLRLLAGIFGGVMFVFFLYFLLSMVKGVYDSRCNG